MSPTSIDPDRTSAFNREASIQRISERTTPWDMVVIGGGATGVGIALDAASRGLAVVLLERFDFGSGTSSRSTKLIHGGVRYLKQGNVTLVRDALRERSLLKENAGHWVHDQTFLIPCDSIWQWLFYGLGLKFYDLLSTGKSFGRSRMVSAATAHSLSPALQRERLRGAVLYHDGQFDDARLLIDMAFTAAGQGGCLVNYANVEQILKSSGGQVTGVVMVDSESGVRHEIHAHTVVNAAGPFCDQVRRLDDDDCQPMVAASQGVHLVLPKEFYPGQTAMIVPNTSDGRVIFIVPWHDHAVVGTTDTAIPVAVAQPKPQPTEISFLLETVSRYLTRPPHQEDILSIFTGIRPLVKGDKSAKTASLSRDHVIRVESSNLITITGGKWTTVRKMAEDCVDHVIRLANLTAGPCATKSMRIDSTTMSPSSDLPSSNRDESSTHIDSDHTSLSTDRILHAVRSEMARTVDDVLSRRTRMLFLNANAAVEIAPKVAAILAAEFGKDRDWEERQLREFHEFAQPFLPSNAAVSDARS